MRITFVADYLPTPKTSGAGVHLWSLVNQAVNAGHQVSYVVLGQPHEYKVLGKQGIAELQRALEAKSVTLVRAEEPHQPPGSSPKILRVAKRLRRTLRPIAGDYDEDFDVAQLRAASTASITATQPDVIFVFNDGPIAAVTSINDLPKVAWPSDPIHLLWRSRWKYAKAKGKRRLLLGVQILAYRGYPKWIVEHLRRYDAVIHQAAHHAAWFRSRGLAKTHYIPTPVVDPPNSNPTTSAKHTDQKLKIVHLGHLGGTASMTGLPILLEETVPELEKLVGQENFELHFIGRVDVDNETAARLQHPSIRLRGFVDDLAAELSAADVFVVPIPHEVGSRTRLLTALAHGCCVVAHESCTLGNPELRHGDNVLLARDGRGLAHEMVAAWRDAALRRRLQLRARESYEQYFSLDTAGKRWLEIIENTAGTGKSTVLR